MAKTKKKPAKKMAKTKRRVCVTKGCRKTAVADGDLCRVCVENSDPLEGLVKITEIEALRFGKLDADRRNDRQAVQLLTYQMTEIKSRAEAGIAGLEMQKRQLEASLTARKPEYKALIQSLADKYEIEDPNQMTIDPDTGVIRDLSKM